MISPIPPEALSLELQERRQPTHRAKPLSTKVSRLASRTEPSAAISSSLELFEGLTRRELRKLRRHFAVVQVDPGTRVGRQDAPCRNFTVVLSGQVAIALDDRPLGIIPKGCFFGAVSLLDPTDQRRRASSTALETSVLALANRRQFPAILDEFPVIAERIMAVAEQRKRALMSRMPTEAEATLDEELEYPIHLLART